MLVLKALPLPQDVIRWTGLVVLVLLGLGMMIPRVETLLEKLFSLIPQHHVDADRGGFVLGSALGAVYVPCSRRSPSPTRLGGSAATFTFG